MLITANHELLGVRGKPGLRSSTAFCLPPGTGACPVTERVCCDVFPAMFFLRWFDSRSRPLQATPATHAPLNASMISVVPQPQHKAT